MERDGERFCSRGSNRMNHTMWNFTSLTEQYHNIVTLTSLQYHNIDLEKAYDRVPREILWKALEKKRFRISYIMAIKDMYEGASTSVRNTGWGYRGFSHNNRIAPRVNPKSLSFYFSFGCTDGTHPRVSIEMYAFCR